MKKKTLMITFFSATAFAVGCHKEESATQQLENVRAKTTTAAQNIQDYSYAQKTEFVEKMRGQLDELNGDLDQLSAKIEKASNASKAEAKPKLQALRNQMAKLNQQLDG